MTPLMEELKANDWLKLIQQAKEINASPRIWGLIIDSSAKADQGALRMAREV